MKQVEPGELVKHWPYGQRRRTKLGEQVRWVCRTITHGRPLRRSRLCRSNRKVKQAGLPWVTDDGPNGMRKEAWSDQLESRSDDPLTIGNRTMKQKSKKPKTLKFQQISSRKIHDEEPEHSLFLLGSPESEMGLGGM